MKNGEEEDDDAKNREQQNSGSGGGGGQTKSRGKEKIAIIQSSEQDRQPLGSKVYDLINKGYVNEKEPW
jgi:Ca-activated chloride channel family protein